MKQYTGHNHLALIVVVASEKKKIFALNAFGQAGLYILFDPVVKDWSIERSH